jgi:cytochrome c6
MLPVARFAMIGVAAVAALAASSFALSSAASSAAPAPTPEQSFTENCSACHQVDGKGIPGAFPALAGDTFVVGPATGPIGVVLNGRAGMPTFKADLTDEQIAAALTYVRSSWGNAAPAVTPDQVNAQRTGAAPAPSKPVQAH